ncbi:MAG: hypothetical protein R2867_00010 [Caldilineaceae bacterium]
MNAMYPLGNILNGEWQRSNDLTDYRTETLSNIVVERAAWQLGVESRLLADTVVADAGYVWLRFWLLEEVVLVEKYYDAEAQPIGYYVPICMPLKRRGNNWKRIRWCWRFGYSRMIESPFCTKSSSIGGGPGRYYPS